MQKSLRKENYFPSLDGLRLLASVNIVLLHLSSSNALVYMQDYKWITPIINAPAFAAGIFYVLAGFLFASKFSDPTRQVSTIPFVLSRIGKLYRLHFLMTLLMFLVLVFKFSGYSHLPHLNEMGDCFSLGVSKMFHPVRSLILHLTLTWSFVPDLGMKLNEPSWSLTSFFICYAITPWVSRVLFKQSSFTMWILFGVFFIPGILWAILFGTTNNLWFDNYDAKYRFFHIFAPVRIFEYLFGMILFCLYKKGSFDFFKKNYVSGIAQIGLLALIYGSLFLLRPEWNPGVNYFFHHSFSVLLYGLFLLSLLSGKGPVAKFFCIPFVRMVGRASFYPYLIHLPMITIAWGICNLNKPLNTFFFMVFIYSVSTLYVEFKRWKKGKKRNNR